MVINADLKRAFMWAVGIGAGLYVVSVVSRKL